MENIPVVNPEEVCERAYLMWAGQCAPTKAYVWADSFESAFEIFVEWLDAQNYTGFFVSDDEFKELLDEQATDMYGKDWDTLISEWVADNGEWAGWKNDMCAEYMDVIEAAEADLTMIGHTTLSSGTYIPSYEWGGDECDRDLAFAASVDVFLDTYASDIQHELQRRHNDLLSFECEWEVDVRLQVKSNGDWYIKVGVTDYDTDHGGFWGSGILQEDMSDEDFQLLTDDLINQVVEAFAIFGDENDYT